MLEVNHESGIQFFESKIHELFDQVENRIIVKESIEVGRIEIIKNMLNSGMSFEKVVRLSPYSVEELETKLNI